MSSARTLQATTTAGKPLHAAMLHAFDYTPVIDTAVEHYGLDRAAAESTLDGLLQWFSVIPFARRGQPVQMVESIDKLWHSFILHTKLYREFCDRFFGRYLDHDPLDRNDLEMSKKQYARFTLSTLRAEFGADVHPAFLDLTQRVSCCYGQCGDDGSGGGLVAPLVSIVVSS
jgi:hypothetical protein